MRKAIACVRLGICIFLVCATTTAMAQTTTDAAQSMANLLVDFGAVPWTHTVTIIKVCREPGPGGVGTRPIRCDYDVTRTDKIVLTPSNVRIIKSDPITFDPLVRTEFPDDLTQSVAASANCSATATSTFSEQLSVSFQRSSSIAISNSISHASSMGLNFVWKITDGLQLGGNVGVTETATHGTIDTTGYQHTVQRTHAVSTSVPPMKAIGASIITWPVHYVATFHSHAIVDADVPLNDKHYSKASDILPEIKRTFQIMGTIGFVDAADAKTVTYDLPFDSKTCPPSARGLIPISSKKFPMKP